MSASAPSKRGWDLQAALWEEATLALPCAGRSSPWGCAMGRCVALPVPVRAHLACGGCPLHWLLGPRRTHKPLAMLLLPALTQCCEARALGLLPVGGGGLRLSRRPRARAVATSAPVGTCPCARVGVQASVCTVCAARLHALPACWLEGCGASDEDGPPWRRGLPWQAG